MSDQISVMQALVDQAADSATMWKARAEQAEASLASLRAEVERLTTANETALLAKDAEWRYGKRLEAENTRLTADLAAAREEIAEARETCPVVRRQDFFDAPLLTLVEEEISQLLHMQSRAEQADASLTALRTALQEACDALDGKIRFVTRVSENGPTIDDFVSRLRALLSGATDDCPYEVKQWSK